MVSEPLRIKKGKQRGTVIFSDFTVPAYPHIPRITNLKEGLQRYFLGKWISVEEKIDGYNVRVLEKDSVMCFLRSGLRDAFSEYKLFTTFSGLRDVVIGEMVGSTPFTSGDFDYDFYAFEVWKDGKSLPIKERREYLESFSVQQPAVLYEGILTEEGINEIKDIVVELDGKGKEGIVIKSQSGKMVKYTCPHAELEDIAENFLLSPSLGYAYLSLKLNRAFLEAEQLGVELDLEKWHQQLVMRVQEFYSRGYVSKSFKIFAPEEVFYRLKQEVFAHSKDVEIVNVVVRKNYISFEKLFKKATAKLHVYLSGKAFVD